MIKWKPDFWTIVFWTSITVVFLWLIAKQLGLFDTPIVVELIPYVGGFLALFATAKQVGKFVECLNRAVTDISEIKGEIGQLRLQMATFDKRLTVVETKLT